MTTLTLLLWIVLGIAVQLAVFLAVAFWRHWLAYQRLRLQADGLEEPIDLSFSETTRSEVAGASGFHPYRVTRKVLEDDAQTACSFYLAPEDKQPLPAFLPGQYLTFRLDIPKDGGSTEQTIRCYSLSDAHQPDHYRVTIKRTPPPQGRTDIPAGRSSNYFHDHVNEGDILQVKSPAGHFHLDGGMAPVVLIASGIGITPMLSMLNWSLAKQQGREIWLFYGARNSREHVMKTHLEALAAKHDNFRLRVCYSNPLSTDVIGRDFQYSGRVSVDLLRLHLPLKPYHFYLCGLPAMMESLVPALDDWGVPESHIHFEAFGPSSVKRHRPATASPGDKVAEIPATNVMVTFAKSGRQLSWNSATGTLLDFAEANGIVVDSGCRAGGCGTCQTTIIDGEVSYPQPPDFDPEPGSCLLCVSIPKTNVTLEA